jgi:excisionase family DNA binding protein
MLDHVCTATPEAGKDLPSTPPRLALSVQELSTSLGISRSQTYKFIANGALQTRKLGRRTIIAMSEAHRFVNSLPEYNNRSPAKATRAKK